MICLQIDFCRFAVGDNDKIIAADMADKNFVSATFLTAWWMISADILITSLAFT